MTVKKIWATGALSAAALLAGTCVSAQQDQDETYEWSAELVSFDESTNSAVVEARVEAHATFDDNADFSEGDRLTLIWTGRHWAAGVRDLAETPELSPGMLTLPVEFVALEDDGRYLQFRVAVPSEAATLLADMESGTRVTATSPKTADAWDEGIISMRHYNDLDS